MSEAKRLKLENSGKNIWILGELIHNSSVTSELEEMGIRRADNLLECSSGICIIRTHGMPPDKIDEIKSAGFEIADLTCPNVKKAQEKAVRLAQEGYPVLIIGNAGHPETAAIKAHAEKYSSKVFVITDAAELDGIAEIIKKEKKAGIVIQTTQKVSLLQEIVSKLLLITNELKVYNTICAASSLRQKAAAELAAKSDLMIVIGGKNSANTIHLAEISSKITQAVHIETAEDLDPADERIKNAVNIGITAGASTPDNIINEVIEKLKTI